MYAQEKGTYYIQVSFSFSFFFSHTFLEKK